MFVLIGAAQYWKYSQYRPKEQPRDSGIYLIDPDSTDQVEKDLRALNPRNRAIRREFAPSLVPSSYRQYYIINYTSEVPQRMLQDPRWVSINCGHCALAFPLGGFDTPLNADQKQTIHELNIIRERAIILHDSDGVQPEH